MTRKKKNGADWIYKRSYSEDDIQEYGHYYVVRSDGGCIRRAVKLKDGRRISERLSVDEYTLKGRKFKKGCDKWEEKLHKICEEKNFKQFGESYTIKMRMRTSVDNTEWITERIKKQFCEDIILKRRRSRDHQFLINVFEFKILKYFVDYEFLPNPSCWVIVQERWGEALMNRPLAESHRIWEDINFQPSAKTIRAIIQLANLFLRFLLKENSKKYSGISLLEPIERSKLKDYENERIKRKNKN